MELQLSWTRLIGNEERRNMNKEELKSIVKELMENELKELINQFDVLNGAIKQRHIDGAVIRRDVFANLPTNGNNSKCYAFFATDTDTLYIWNGVAWVSEVLT